MKKGWVAFLLVRIVLILSNLFPPAFAQQQLPIMSRPPIKIGSSTSLEGPAKALGQGVTLGERLYLNRTNQLGGVHGQPLDLILYNDSYEPKHTATNIRKLITKDNVLAIIGNVGAPTAVVSVPIVNELKTLLYACYTGADVIYKNPPDRYVFSFRASHAEETASIIKGLLAAGIKPDEIAFFTQNDALGDSGYFGAIKALKELGYKDTEKLVHARFTRNTVNIEDGLTQILDIKKTPKAIIIIAPYLPASKFIKLAIQDMPHTLFVNVAFVGSDALAKELGQIGNKQVIVTQVVPSYDSSLPAIQEYKDDLKKYAKDAEPGYISLEGYLATKLFVLALQRAAATDQLTKEGIVNVMEQMHDVDIGIGIPIGFDRNDHTGLHKVWPTLLKDGKFVPLDWTHLQPGF